MNPSAPPPDPERVALAVRKLPAMLEADGAALHHDFVTPGEEQELLAYFDSQPWDESIKRRTQHYGRRFDYERKSVGDEPSASLPPCIRSLIRRLPMWPSSKDKDGGHAANEALVQVTINEYVPGVGIAAHVDTHSAFADGIVSLTLGAGIAFRMQQRERAKHDCTIWLPPRSLFVMSGASRYAWRHGISGRKYDRVEAVTGNGAATSSAVDPPLASEQGFEWVPRQRRVSVTMRRLLPGGVCSCAWPALCDSQEGAPLALPTRIQRPTADAATSASAATTSTTSTATVTTAASTAANSTATANGDASSTSSASSTNPPASSVAARQPQTDGPPPVGGTSVLMLLGVRLLNALLVATYHDPDEVWQLHEVAHRLAFGSGSLTWEWVHGLRSHVHVVPFALCMKLLEVCGLDSAASVAHAPRLLQAGIAACNDVCLWKLADAMFGPGSGAMAVGASLSSWFVWYCGVRTYTSSAEAPIVAAALVALTRRPAFASSAARWVPAAALGALAVAVRPTALLLLLPLALCALCGGRHQSIDFRIGRNGTGAAGSGDRSVPPSRSDGAAALAIAAATTLLVLFASAAVDRLCYGRWVLPASSFLRFNLVSGGSAYYGTHPWHWYVSAGMPAALGTHTPLVILGLVIAIRPEPGRQRLGEGWLRVAPALGAGFALAALSLSSHKELRFVYPLVHPLLLCYAGGALHSMTPRRRRSWWAFLVLTNLPAAAYLSWWHQRAPMEAMGVLRNEASRGRLHHLDLLTRCHQTPGPAALHGLSVHVSMLHCPPPALFRLVEQSHAMRARRRRRLTFLAATLERGPSRQTKTRRRTPTTQPPPRAPSLRAVQEARGLPWMPSPHALRMLYPKSPPACANECDCFLEGDVAAAIEQRYRGGGRGWGLAGAWMWWLTHGLRPAARRVWPRLLGRLPWLRQLRSRAALAASAAYVHDSAVSNDGAAFELSAEEDAEVTAGVHLATLPSHVLVFDELLAANPRAERALRRRGFAVSRSFFHQLTFDWPGMTSSGQQEGVSWLGMLPELRVRRLLLLTRHSR